MIKNRKTIIHKLLIPMIIILVLQVALFISAILSSGIIKIMNDNSFNILNQKVELRNNYLKNEMLNHWSNIDRYENKINNTILESLKAKGLTVNDLENNTELTNELLGNVSNNLIAMLRKNYVTGAFLIFNNKDEKNGLYFRDLDPNSVSIITGNS